MKYVLVFLADWANGLFAVVGASYITGTELEWWHFLIGIALSHSPDMDALGEIFKRGKVAASGEHAHDHRDGLHYPILWLMVGTGATVSFGYWGWMFFLATALHFINDLYGTGWGIKLFWPISERSYKVLACSVNRPRWMLKQDGDWDNLPDKERKLSFLVSWSKEELPDYMKRWGIENWIEPTYLKINWISGVEYTLFIISVVLALVYYF